MTTSPKTCRVPSKYSVIIIIILATFFGFFYFFSVWDISFNDSSDTSIFCSLHAKTFQLFNDDLKPQTISQFKLLKFMTKQPLLCKKPRKHIVFLKVHKTGSSTMLNLIYRYGWQNNLIFALPQPNLENYFNRFAKDFTSSCIAPIPKGLHYDLLCNHAVYNRTTLRPLFPQDTFYFSIIRHPFTQFVSACNFYGLVDYKELQGPDPYRKYLQNRNNFPVPKGFNFFDNRMSFDLGLDPNNFHNYSAIQKFLSSLDEDFNLILIFEYFDESLVLLRRHLCWTIKEILCFKLNSAQTKNDFVFSVNTFSLHKNQTTADYALYNHYLKIFWEKIYKQGASFFAELSFFKLTQNRIRNFCQQKAPPNILIIETSEWNETFNITKSYCGLMMKIEFPFLADLRIKQQKLFGSPKKIKST